jgi:PAS domain-containing protein
MSADIPPVLERWANETQDLAVLILAPEARVTWANDAMARVLGYSPTDLARKSLRMIFTPEDLQRGLDQHELDVPCKDGPGRGRSLAPLQGRQSRLLQRHPHVPERSRRHGHRLYQGSSRSHRHTNPDRDAGEPAVASAPLRGRSSHGHGDCHRLVWRRVRSKNRERCGNSPPGASRGRMRRRPSTAGEPSPRYEDHV